MGLIPLRPKGLYVSTHYPLCHLPVFVPAAPSILIVEAILHDKSRAQHVF